MLYQRSRPPQCDAQVSVESSIVCLIHHYESSSEMYFSELTLYRKRHGFDVGYEWVGALNPKYCDLIGYDLREKTKRLEQVATNEIKLIVDGSSVCRFKISDVFILSGPK